MRTIRTAIPVAISVTVFLSSCWIGRQSQTNAIPARPIAVITDSGNPAVTDTLKKTNPQQPAETGTGAPDGEDQYVGCVGTSFQSCNRVNKNSESVSIEGYDWNFASIKSIDPKTVEPVFFPNGEKNLVIYLKDKNRIFYPFDNSNGVELREIEGFDAKNFKMLPGTGPSIGGAATAYITDGGNVYFGNTRVSGADIESFVVFKGSYYSKDRNNVYFLGDYCQKTPECAADGSNYKKLEWADPASFKVLGWTADSYAKDKNNAYFNGNVVSWADSITFEFVGSEGIWGDFAKDKNHAYSLDKVFKDGQTDSTTFYMDQDGNVHDKNHPKEWQ